MNNRLKHSLIGSGMFLIPAAVIFADFWDIRSCVRAFPENCSFFPENYSYFIAPHVLIGFVGILFRTPFRVQLRAWIVANCGLAAFDILPCNGSMDALLYWPIEAVLLTVYYGIRVTRWLLSKNKRG